MRSVLLITHDFFFFQRMLNYL